MTRQLTTEARHGKRRPRRVAYRIFKVLGLMIACSVIASLSLAGIVASSITTKVNTFELGDPAEQIPKIGAYEGEINILLIGSDTRNGLKGSYGDNPGSTLNDVNILFHMDKTHSNATVVSIPRDTFVTRPTCQNGTKTYYEASHVKINSILSDGGIRCVRDTVEQMTGLDIPFVSMVTFDGVTSVTNAIGGVQVCVAQRIDDDYTGLHLSKGTHTLKGANALKFLRTRHGVGDGSDLTRISSQQVFLSSLVRKIKSNDTLTDLTKMYPLAEAVASNTYLSSSLNNVDTLVSIAQALAPIDLDKIVFVQYPTRIVTGGVEPNTTSASALFKALRAGNSVKLSAASSSSNVGMPGSVATKKKASSTKASATPSPSPTPTATDKPAKTTTLPSDIYGQPASTSTCSVGNNLGRR